MMTLKKNDVEEMWDELRVMKQKFKEGFFIYFDEHRPVFES